MVKLCFLKKSADYYCLLLFSVCSLLDGFFSCIWPFFFNLEKFSRGWRILFFSFFQGYVVLFNVFFLAEGDGSKIYVSCVAFRDPVSEDIAEAYRIPANSFADKCICLVSRSPSFGVLRNALEELFKLCFSPAGSR